MTPRISWLAMVTAVGPTLLLSAGTARATQPAPTALVIHGRGDGHGVGLPQDGALALGRAGRTAAQILDTFYPGTTLQSDRTARMHVEVWQDAATTGSAQISLPSGGRIYGPQGHVAVPAGGLVDLTFAGDQWAARLATIPLGSGGRSVPRSLTDDPSPDPASGSPSPADPSASADAPAATPSQASPDATATDAAPTLSPAPAAEATNTSTPEATGAAAQQSASAPSTPPTPPSAASTAERSAERATVPTAVPTTGTVAATVQTSVSGSLLDIVPAGTEGVTTVVSTGRSYRGQVLTAPGELVNDVPLELYLRGLGEVLDPSWPTSGLQAFVIAARTYALRDALGAADPGDHQHVNICATDACQVYLGAGVEYPQLTQAVEATKGDVLEYQGALAETYYSASAGGETASPSEGFGDGSTDVPYLTPVTYDDGGHDGWQRTIDLGAAATALHYPGQLTELEVTARGPSGRATAVLLHGSGGDVPTTGVAVEAALGLPSTLFTTGFGIDAPQVALATSGSVLPALTAASLGQVAVPAPVLAADPGVAPSSVAGQPSAASSATSDRSELRPGWSDTALAVAAERTPVGVVVWFGLLGWLVVTAVVVLASRLLSPLLRRPGSHRAAQTVAAAD